MQKLWGKSFVPKKIRKVESTLYASSKVGGGIINGGFGVS